MSKTLKKSMDEIDKTDYDHITNLLENYDLLITVEKHHRLPRPFQRQHDMNKNNEEIEKERLRYNRAHVHQLRMRFDKSHVERRKSADFPKLLKFTNMMVYGRSLATYVIYQLAAKQSDGLWRILAYILQQVPTATAIALLNQYKTKLIKVQDVDNLDLVMSSVIQSSTYTVACSLYLRFVVFSLQILPFF